MATELTGVQILVDGVPIAGQVEPDDLIEVQRVDTLDLGTSFFMRIRPFQIILPTYDGDAQGFAEFALGVIEEVSERLGIPIEDLLEDTSIDKDMNGIQEPESVHDAAELAVLSGGSAFDYDFDFDEACQNVEAVRDMVEDSD